MKRGGVVPLVVLHLPQVLGPAVLWFVVVEALDRAVGHASTACRLLLEIQQPSLPRLSQHEYQILPK